MGRILIVLGPSGSGKSRSIKNLNPDETIVINVLKKDLPFRGSRAIYSAEKKNIVSISDWDKVVNFIGVLNGMPHIKQLIIDDVRFVMEKEFMKRAKETGYIKFTELGQHFHAIIEAAENAREDLVVVLMMHDDDVVNDKIIVSKKVKLVGKLVEDHYNPIEVVPICLYCKPTFDKNDNPIFQFYTQKTLIDGVEIPAKSPEDMFEAKMPNDLNIVIKAMKSYYEE